MSGLDIREQAPGPRPGPAAATGTAESSGNEPSRKLIFLVTEDWYFCSHRLPVARAARDAGFEVVVATRVREHGARILAEGFRLHPLPWRRRGDGIIGACRAIAAIAALYRREQPDIAHHVALKPALFGGLALRIAFPRRADRPTGIAAVAGLGSQLTGVSGFDGLRRRLLGWALRLATGGGPVIVQNPDDGVALSGFGIDPAKIALIRGSGIDITDFRPLPEPAGPGVTVALVARMLRSKGVLDAVSAVRRLRARGTNIALLLAGAPDPDNGDSLDAAELRALAAEPGIEWLGYVADVRAVWQRAAIAVLPSSYGEGVPKALLEAAACGRPIVTTDMPGCRDVVRTGSADIETGLLTPPHDIAALADALAVLATDPDRRRAMGKAGRLLIEREFGDRRIAEQTLDLYRATVCQRDASRGARR